MKVIVSSQCGFTEGKSCYTNLIRVYDEKTDLVDEGSAVDIDSFDLTKAFSTVPYRSPIR